jgi:hypothetical protein
MTALSELAEEADILSADDVADEARVLGEEWTEAIHASIASLRRAWSVWKRLVQRERAPTPEEARELQFFASCAIWHAWAPTCVGSVIRRKLEVEAEVLEVILLLIRRTAREGFVAGRAVELVLEDRPIEMPGDLDDPEVDTLEAEAQLQAEEALAEIEAGE